MFAAARGLCGHNPGIACILGNRFKLVLLQREGHCWQRFSAGLHPRRRRKRCRTGQLLVGDVLKNQTSPALKEKFLSEVNLTPGEIIDRVYRQPFPTVSGKLVAFPGGQPARTGNSWTDIKQLHGFKRNVMQYDYRNNPVHIIGSVAYHYKEILTEAAQKSGITLGTIHTKPHGRTYCIPSIIISRNNNE